MNDLPLHVKNSLCIMFCDDTGLIISGDVDKIDDVIDMIEQDLMNVSNWMTTNRQTLNESKCEMVIVCNKKDMSKLCNVNVKINDTVIKRVPYIKILGVIIDENLTFNAQCSAVIKKCNGALWSLGPLKNILAVKQKKIVVEALVLSILYYACPIWLIGKNNKKSADKIIRSCARFVYCKRKYDSISDNINVDLNWLNVEYMCIIMLFIESD
jgi:hypothetical protein